MLLILRWVLYQSILGQISFLLFIHVHAYSLSEYDQWRTKVMCGIEPHWSDQKQLQVP